MRVGWVCDRFFLRHDTGASHPERLERIEAIVNALAADGLLDRVMPLDARAACVDELERVHEPAYVELVRLACEQGMAFLGDRETRICSESYEVARLAVGGVLTACEVVMANRVQRAFCAVRPPGHHAGRDHAAGYCLFNNVAVAAESLIRRHGLARVAIVDWDVHHGNGTQSIFEDRDDVLFISLHESPQSQYPGTGYENETGRGRGVGCTLNVPMRPGSGDAEYRRAFAEKVIPKLDAYAPECILVSAGFDAASEDRTSSINLEPASFAWMTQQVLGVAAKHGRGRFVSVLEGGYDLPSLGRCVAAHVRALLDVR
jgi:acetoin utilization deacetylase AcuC-like enzyme